MHCFGSLLFIRRGSFSSLLKSQLGSIDYVSTVVCEIGFLSLDLAFVLTSLSAFCAHV